VEDRGTRDWGRPLDLHKIGYSRSLMKTIVLGIETSCDETAICIIEAGEHGVINSGNEVKEPFNNGPEIKVLGNALQSQIEIHAKHGGVFPALAKREHSKNITPLFIEALKKSGLYQEKKSTLGDEEKAKILVSLKMEHEMAADVIQLLETIEKPNIDVIAVTQGPGLEPALWVGINFAKTLGTVWNIKVVPTNHMEGHIVSVLVDSEKEKNVTFPALALLISGGHTELVLIKSWHEYSVIGRTRDDAVGEAFDKVARILGLEYPGGPKISALAKKSRERVKNENIVLPRPMLNTKDYDFSFSGLKTAVLYLVKKMGELSETDKEDIAREFEDSATEVLVKKTRQAMIDHNVRTIIIGGGVIANENIRGAFQKMTSMDFIDVNLFIPQIEHSTDNAIMIAVAGYMRFVSKVDSLEVDFKASGNLSL